MNMRLSIRLLSIRAELLALCLIFVVSGGCGRSGPPATVLVIHVDPNPVPVGRRAQVSVTIASPNPGMRFRWFASLGSFLPSETATNMTVYVAPSQIQVSEESLPVSVRVEVFGSGESPSVAEGLISVIATGHGQSETVVKRSAGDIEITQVPLFDEIGGPVKRDRIAGTVTGFDRQENRILLYSKTDDWYVQPQADAPLLMFGPDGKFDADIFLGTEYAVFVVKRTYEAPARTPFLPRIDDQVLKLVRVKGRNEKQ